MISARRLNIKSILKIAIFPLLLLLTVGIYLPGLGSQFLLDDFYNLQNLDQVKEYGYGAYIFSSGIAGPSGRPLSLLSFALQHESWPHNPVAFKLVNICLHLVNGFLVFMLCRLLAGLILKDRIQQLLMSAIATVLWLMHPIQISTTLYVVQRMTQISTMFTLLGVIGYLHYRLKISNVFDTKILLILSFIVPLCTLLAFLGKENGALLPLYLLIIEGTLLSNFKKYKYLEIWKYTFLVFPLIVLVIYFTITLDGVFGSYQFRDYSLQQKVFTEGVVLIEYIKNIVFPHPSVFGLYHDDYAISESLFTPPTTFLSVAALLGMILMAIRKRKALPVLSFSIFWFLGGHILESTYLNLELYFEHRNYLPSFGLFFLMAWLVIKAADSFSRKSVVYMTTVIYCLLVIVVTKIEIDIWSKPGVQAVEWARRHPQSKRALNDLMQFYLVNNDHENVVNVLTRLENMAPDHMHPHLQRLNLFECKMSSPISDTEWNDFMEHAIQAKADGLITVAVLDQLVLNIVRGSCPDLDVEKLETLIMRLSVNPEFSGIGSYLYEYLSTLAIYTGDYQYGLTFIQQSLSREFTVPRKIQEIKLLYEMGEAKPAKVGREELEEYIGKDYRLKWGYGRMVEAIQFQ